MTISKAATKPLAALLVEAADGGAEPLDRLRQIVALGDQPVAARLDLGELDVGAEVDGAEPLALLAQGFELLLDLLRFGQGRVALVTRERREAGRLAVEIGQDRVQELRLPGLSRLDARLRRGAGFARLSHRVERSAGGAIGLGERGLALGAGVGGVLAERLGVIELVGERAAAAGEFGRRVRERLALGLGGGAPFGEFGDLGFRAPAPLIPGAALGGDRCLRAARASASRVSVCKAARASANSARVAAARRACALESEREIVARRQRRQRAFRQNLALGRFVARGFGAGGGFLDRREPGQRLGALALEFGERRAGAVRSGAGLARALPPFALGCGGVSQRRGGALRLAPHDFDRLARGFGLAHEIAEAVLFGETTRGGGRRVGRGDETVPAPEIAFERHQPLADFEKPAQALAFAARHDADLREAARERGRGGRARSQRLDARRQHWISAVGGEERPVRLRRLVERRLEVVAERGPERRLVAASDADRVDHRRKVLVGA